MKDTKKLKIFDRDLIKCLAVFIMFWGHLFAWIVRVQNPEIEDPYPLMPFWQQLLSHFSLFCPPIMFFMVADGYKYTRDRKKYAIRLLVFACITQVFHWLLWAQRDDWWTSNVIFTLFFGLLAIMAWESKYKLWQRIAVIILLICVNTLMMSDWIIFGILFILLLHIYRERPKKRAAAYTVLALIWKLIAIISSLGTKDIPILLRDNLLDLLPVFAAYLCMTVFYNGKKGKYPGPAKWFFYIFYPAHYLIIFIVYKVIT